MTITNIYGLAFAGFGLLIYLFLPRKCQWIFLLGVSIVFYLMSGTPYTILYVFFSVLSVYAAALSFQRLGRTGKKAAFISVLTVNVFLLIFFKHFNLISFMGNVFRLDISGMHFFAPLAMSYYMLQILSYLIDCYWGEEAERNPFKLCLFILYFPQMTFGPISRWSQIGGQLVTSHQFDYKRITFGLQRIVWGLLKKLVLAERIGFIVDPVYASYEIYSGITLLLIQFMFMIQLYMDFSGGIDVIMGISECYGIILPENFRTPFFSRTVQEFWQRWHITLGTWLKDYIMYPLLKSMLFNNMRKSLKKKGFKMLSRTIPPYLAMLVLWLITGIWHGNGTKYIVGVGIWMWLVIVLEQVLEPVAERAASFFRIDMDGFFYKSFQIFRTFVFISVGNIFFRADTLAIGFGYLRRAVTFASGTIMPSIQLNNAAIIAVALILWLIIYVIADSCDIREVISGRSVVFRMIFYNIVIWIVILFGIYGGTYTTAGFLYQQF